MSDEILILLQQLRDDMKDISGRLSRIEDFLTQVIQTGELSGPPVLDKIPITTPIELDQDIILKAMNLSGDYIGDVFIFKQFYLKDGREASIRKNSKKFEYWDNNEWKEIDKRLLGKVIVDKIKPCYIKYNKVDIVGMQLAHTVNMRLVKMREPKYLTELCDKIFEAISENNF
jgi:hypothetical protein